MSKLTKALEVIQSECDKHFMCDTCSLQYRNEYGTYGCRLDYWGITQGKQPRDWPINEVREVEHER
jgi:hypothetical protein